MNKEKMYNTFMMTCACLVGMMIIFIAAISIRTCQTQQEIEQQGEDAFYAKCATTCYPNTVYSIKYNRCSCNAAVIYKDVE